MQIIEEAKVVADALKTIGEPIQLKDLVDLTRDKVQWKNPKAMTAQMVKFMKYNPTIGRGERGFYLYLGDNEDDESQEIDSTQDSEESQEDTAIETVEEEQLLEPTEETSSEKLLEDKDSEELKNDEVKEKPTQFATTVREDDSVLDVTERDKELLESFRKSTVPIFTKKKKHFKAGDFVVGKVTGIEDYGVFITNDEDGMQGLIHITQVGRMQIDSLYRHFKMGDTVRAKIISVKPNGKIALTTKDFTLPDYFVNNTIAEKLKPIADKLGGNEVSVETPVQSPVENKSEEPSVKKEESDEIKEVYRFVQSITGVVSDNAKEKIQKLIEDNGMFKFAMGLAEVQRDFEVDVSMMLVDAVEDKVTGGL